MKQEFIAGIIMALIGILININPKFTWKIAESWKNKEAATPSKAYMIVLRSVGIVMAIIGSLLMSGVIK